MHIFYLENRVNIMFNWFKRNLGENPPQSHQIKFLIHDEKHVVNTDDDIDADTMLNEYLRNKMFLTGTKRMCYEGGCGACVVAVTKPGDDKKIAINSCLVSILTCHGWKIETVEGIGGPLNNYHSVQKALAEFNGTQCGFCSPGMVMNMYALLENGKPTMKEVENSFGGNICRCTGYRPILTAFKTLSGDASKDLLGTYPDIEDFVFVKNPNRKLKDCGQPFRMNLKKTNWYKVYDLKDVLNILSKNTVKSYMLVAGNTAKGVYDFPKVKTYIDVIEVKELTSYKLEENTLTLGGNMSLTNAMELFYEISGTNEKFSYLKTMADHIDLIANVPVRNVGTLAGNLMMKYFHHEFPSDIFLILETFLASFIIVDTNGTETTIRPSDLISYDMNKKVMKSIQLPSLSKEFKYDTHKIMPRAQNAHAHVNAGFLFQLDSYSKVKSARIVYGNINPTFIHAKKTEEYLIGKELFNNTTLQGAFKMLEAELVPDSNPPDPSPEFRKQLAISLLYKSIILLAPDSSKLNAKIKSGGEKLQRPVSSGTQDYETNKSLYPLTKPIPKLEALAQTSGQAQYIEDIPDHPHQLYGKFVLADAAAGSKISKIDASKAMSLKGAVEFFTRGDIPGGNNFIPIGIGNGIIEKIFCDTVVEYYHQPVGLIVVSKRDILYQAADLVEITYTKSTKPPILTTRDVLKAKDSSRIIKEHEIKPEKVGIDVKHELKGKFNIEGQYHFHMETQCCLAVPNEDGLDMYPSTQWMDIVQVAVANTLNIHHNKINVVVRRCGGAFGAKISRSNQIACAAGLAAWLLRKPVRVSLSLKDNMKLCGKRIPFFADYQVKVNDAGVIQYFSSKMYSDHGVGGNENSNEHLLIKNIREGSYDSDPFDVVLYRTKTDNAANTWARAPGNTESSAFMESIMDQISYELNMDPVDVRINNIRNQTLISYLGDLIEWADIDKRKQDILKFNQENRWKKRGISVVPNLFSFLPSGPLTATISIYHVDGTVTISHGGIEIGQGINTKAAQVCAYKFNIPMEKVNVYPSNSMVSANCTTTGGSVTSEGICYSVGKACDELLLRLKPYKKNDLSQTWEELIQAAFADMVLLTANAQYSPKEPSVNPYKIYGTCASEVEVDILTGQHILKRVDIIEDVGTSLSPYVDIGQVEGAFVMGLGYYTTEKLVYDENGKLLTDNTWTYKPPGAKDIPVDFRVKFPKNNPNPLGVFQSKAVGEPPLCLSVSVPLAIRNALVSARSDSDSTQPKYVTFDNTTNVEFTFMNSLNGYKQYIL